MKCYVCEENGGAGGTRFGIRDAVGICQVCGVGVCRQHSHRDPTPEARLLCGLHAAAPVEEPAYSRRPSRSEPVMAGV